MDAAAVALFTLFDLFVLAWNVCALSFSALRKRSFAKLRSRPNTEYVAFDQFSAFFRDA
jgi:hypothetical protein